MTKKEERIFDLMEPGVLYRPRELSEMTGRRSTDFWIYAVLQGLVDQGYVERIEDDEPDPLTGFYLSKFRKVGSKDFTYADLELGHA